MSEPLVNEQPDLSDLTGSPGPKRKREATSPSAQRNPKRVAPQANMDTASFIERAVQHLADVENANANNSNSNSNNNGVNVADFTALQQAAREGTEAADTSNATSTAQAVLGMYPTLHIPSSTEEQFAAQAAAEANGHHNALAGLDDPSPQVQHQSPEQQPQAGQPQAPPPPQLQAEPQPEAQVHQQHDHVQPEHDGQKQHDMTSPDDYAKDPSVSESAVPQNNSKDGVADASDGSSRYHVVLPYVKPTVGSEEWHKMRKDNHKEVERRRRETINEGINELAKIVPGCEKNKGSILQRACQFITQLKENEQHNIEKWTLEKLLTEQAITELSTSNDKLKAECERLYREFETWKRVAQNAGLEAPLQTNDKEEAAPTTTEDKS
ncbi:uncharacterized protein F5Z01DRAFT_674762 [Emericellopsis atlantica]|uniref:BHLH domain-containing protein n=1 Tax=Emericellopsis atlantica TaxID=2614577 RepID=A0A9P7ZKN7_9HYPO|nr:uncharacterized protein F5Z01DRAFT_674762 [Emericellopsis atlantica]KAG9253883.1 hypothetical protein F5Z01DRAFT_674762 [Emericellopsis atlantica]